MKRLAVFVLVLILFTSVANANEGIKEEQDKSSYTTKYEYKVEGNKVTVLMISSKDENVEASTRGTAICSCGATSRSQISYQRVSTTKTQMTCHFAPHNLISSCTVFRWNRYDVYIYRCDGCGDTTSEIKNFITFESHEYLY